MPDFSTVGHYTQVVWSSTTDLGCAVAVNPSCGSLDQYWVCRYSPAGNLAGVLPYDFVSNPCVDLDNDDVLQANDADDTDRTVQ